MVSKDALSAEAADETYHTHRVGTPIDEVTDEDEPIDALLIVNDVEQR
jgi:hypothetical protein